MRHPTDGTLRRLIDEPAGVPDADRAHIAACPTCLDDLERMALVRDAFNSTGLFNPGKVLPEPGMADYRVAIPVGVSAAVGPETWV